MCTSLARTAAGTGHIATSGAPSWSTVVPSVSSSCLHIYIYGRLASQAFSSSHNEYSSINVRQRSRSQFKLCYLPSSSIQVVLHSHSPCKFQHQQHPASLGTSPSRNLAPAILSTVESVARPCRIRVRMGIRAKETRATGPEVKDITAQPNKSTNLNILPGYTRNLHNPSYFKRRAIEPRIAVPMSHDSPSLPAFLTPFSTR